MAKDIEDDNAQYELNSGDLCLVVLSDDGGSYEYKRISNEITVLKHSGYIDGEGKNIEVEFVDSHYEKKVNISFPFEDLVLRPRKCLNHLIQKGFEINLDLKISFVIHHVTRYILKTPPKYGVTELTRWLGWNDDIFYLPESSFALGEGLIKNKKTVFRPVLFNGEDLTLNCDLSNTYKNSEKELEAWQNKLSIYARENSQLAFAISASFAAVLMHPLEQQGVAFHFAGETSIGKTIICYVASTVWGKAEVRKRHWGGSMPQVERFLSSNSDSIVVLDEVKQKNSVKQFGELIYLISHGQPRMIMTSSKRKQSLRNWNLLMLSSGEVGVSEFLAESGQVMGGQLVRLIELEAEIAPKSAFEKVPAGFSSSETFSDYLKIEQESYYGHPIRFFLDRLLKKFSSKEDMKADFTAFIDSFLKKVAKKKRLSGQESRVARSFGIVAYAGEKSTELSITSWKKHDATKNTIKCFERWRSNVLAGSRSTDDRQVIDLFVLTVNKEKGQYIEAGDIDRGCKTINPTLTGYRGIYKDEPALFLPRDYILVKIYNNHTEQTKRAINAISSSTSLFYRDKGRKTGRVDINKRIRAFRNGQNARFYIVSERALESYLCKHLL